MRELVKQILKGIALVRVAVWCVDLLFEFGLDNTSFVFSSRGSLAEELLDLSLLLLRKLGFLAKTRVSDSPGDSFRFVFLYGSLSRVYLVV